MPLPDPRPATNKGPIGAFPSMHKITVYCGNGGDFEFENERYNWRVWILKCITAGKETFEIKPNREADRADIYFENQDDAVLFKLTAPEWMDWRVIADLHKSRL